MKKRIDLLLLIWLPALVFGLPAQASVVSLQVMNGGAQVFSETSGVWNSRYMLVEGPGSGFSADVPVRGHFAAGREDMQSSLKLTARAGENGISGVYWSGFESGAASPGDISGQSAGLSVFTMEAWVKFVDIGEGSGVAVTLGRYSDNSPIAKFRHVPQYDMSYFQASFGGQWKTAVKMNVKDGKYQWHHLAATYDGTYLRFFYDGALADEQQVSVGLQWEDDIAPFVGFEGTGANFFEGYIDDFCVRSEVVDPRYDIQSGWYGALDYLVVVPEPASLCLMSLAVFIVLVTRKRHLRNIK